MRNKLIVLFLTLCLFSSMTSFSFGLTEPEQPTIDESNPTASNELIEDYNKQVDEYNTKVDEYNQQIDTNYEEAYTVYIEEKEKVEANNEFVDKVEEKVKADSSEARGFENNTTSTDALPTDWSDTASENNQTIQVEKSENPTGNTIKAINLHVYLGEDVNIYEEENQPTFYESIEDYSFELSEKIKAAAILVEWEIAEIDYDDTITMTSEASSFAGNIVWLNGKRQWLGANPQFYFFRSIDGYTQGYWHSSGDMLATTATVRDWNYVAGTAHTVYHAEEPATIHYSYNGQDMTEEIMVRTTDRQKPKNIFTLFTYIFTRLAPEPEKQELPEEPVKEPYLSYLDKLNLLEVPTTIPTKPTPTPTPIKNSIYGYGDPEDDIIIATTNPPTTIVDNPTPKTEPEKGSWAFINLIATILACICALALLFVRKDTEDDEPTDKEKKDMRKILATKIASILVGIISVIAFILTEDMSLPIVLTDKWTFLMILLLIIEIVNIFIIRRQSKGEEDDDNN